MILQHTVMFKYVFDVSNVHAVKPNGRYPKAWKLREEHKSDVLHRLEQIYGSTDSTKPFEKELLKFQISSRRMPIQNFKLIIRIYRIG